MATRTFIQMSYYVQFSDGTYAGGRSELKHVPKEEACVFYETARPGFGCIISIGSRADSWEPVEAAMLAEMVAKKYGGEVVAIEAMREELPVAEMPATEEMQ